MKCPMAHSITAYYECPYSSSGNCTAHVCAWYDEENISSKQEVET